MTKLLGVIYDLLDGDGICCCLIKPQFEAGREALNDKGIVKSDAARKNAVDRVVSSAAVCGFENLGVVQSPIEGGDGNIEFLAYFRYTGGVD